MRFTRLVFLLFVVLLMVLESGQAGTISQECKDVTPYDYPAIMECEIGSYAASGSTFYQTQIDYYLQAILQATRGTDIDLAESSNYYAFFRFLFVGLLVLVTVLTGYSFMISSGDPIKREEAKKTFKYILLVGVLVAFLPIILALGYNLSTAVTSIALNLSTVNEETFARIPLFGDPGEEGADQEVARFSEYHAQIPSFVFAANAYIISMNGRHLLLLLLISISPLILLLYIYSPLRSYGKLLAYLLGIELIYPALAILGLHFALSLGGNQINFLLLTSALLLCVLLHAILLAATILKASMQLRTSIHMLKV